MVRGFRSANENWALFCRRRSRALTGCRTAHGAHPCPRLAAPSFQVHRARLCCTLHVPENACFAIRSSLPQAGWDLPGYGMSVSAYPPPSMCPRRPSSAVLPAGGDLLKRTPVRALQMQPQAAPATGTMAPPQAPRQPPARTAPEPSPSPARPQTRAPMLDMLQTPASAPRQGGIGGGHFVGQNLTDGCPPLMAIAFPTPPSAAPLGGRQGAL